MMKVDRCCQFEAIDVWHECHKSEIKVTNTLNTQGTCVSCVFVTLISYFGWVDYVVFVILFQNKRFGLFRV